jgi:multiple sugar transport system substrate-binding protein
MIALPGAGALLAACGAPGAADGGGEAAVQSAGKRRDPVTLRSWWATPGADNFPAFEAADRAIRAKYPHCTVDFEVRPPGDYIAAVVAAAAANSLPDFLYAQGTQIQGFIKQGLIKALDAYLAKDKDFDLKDFPAVALKLYARDGKQFAVPPDHGPIFLWYNKDLFEKEGIKPPNAGWTMDDLLDAAKRLTKPGGAQWGMTNFIPAGGWTLHGSYLGPWGGRFLNEDETETFVDSKESIQALEFWAATRLTHRVNPLPPDIQSVQRGYFGLFIQGTAAMHTGGSWDYRSMKVAQIPFVADIADWPKGPKARVSSSMGSAYPMSSATQHPDDCWLYMREFLGKDLERSVMGQWARTGVTVPLRHSLMPLWEKSEFAPPSAKIVGPAESYSVIGRPVSPAKAELDKIVNAAFAPVWEGKTAIAEAAREIKRQALPLLEGNKQR